MICPKCGREIPDGTVCPCTYQSPALSSNPAVNVIKTVGSSTIFLIMAILGTVGFVLTMISNVSDTSGAIEQYIYELMYNYTGINPAYYASATETAGISSVISLISGSAVSALTVVALWIHYATCKNQKNGNISTAALTIWKVFTWIAIVGLIIACVGVAILVVAIAVMGSATMPSDEYGLLVGVVVFLMIFFGALVGLALACEIAKLRVINRAKTIAYNGIPDNRVSQFLIVMTWIGGISSALTGLSSLFLLPVIGIANLSSAAVSILTALCLTRYKKEMTAVMYPPVQPVYAQPIYAQPASSAAPVAPEQSVAPVTEQTAEQPETPAESDSEESE